MKLIKPSTLRHSIILRLSCWLYLFLSILIAPPLSAQTNLVPNPGFEEVNDCDFDYGAVDRAVPWQIIDPPSSPDLYHACATSLNGVPPVGCNLVSPNSGDGMVGMAHVGLDERIYARLLDDLPIDHDIYVAFSTIPISRCDDPFSTLCYSNTQSLAFADVQLYSPRVALALGSVLNNTEEWTKLQTCYQASGLEKMILIGNYTLASETQMDCAVVNPQVNLSYYFVDDIIVAPFDVVPDTLFICGDDDLAVDTRFFDLPLQWDDGWIGGERIIDEEGSYTVMGDTGNCFLVDTTMVIKIPDEIERVEMDLCESGEVQLKTLFPAQWSNGEMGNAIIVDKAGSYTAVWQSPCGERVKEFVLEEEACAIRHFVPNIFSPNRDGINDYLEFFFAADDEFTGELNVFDRWGNQLFNARNVSETNPARWDGSFRGKQLESGVFVWVYRYVSAKDGKERTIAGNVTLIR